jgi:hypothetical protein
MLKRAEAQPCEANPLGKFAQFMRTGSMDDLADAVGPKKCACGSYGKPFVDCQNAKEHQRIADEIRTRFPKGTRIYYNRWAYYANDVGTVVGYPRPGTLFNWARIKFERLKSVRCCPVYSEDGWHISKSPLSREERGNLRGGMDQWENAAEDFADRTCDDVMAGR